MYKGHTIHKLSIAEREDGGTHTCRRTQHMTQLYRTFGPSTMEKTKAIAVADLLEPKPARIISTTTYDLRWEDAYQRLCAFHQRHGHTNISYRCKEDPMLGRWGAWWRRRVDVAFACLLIQFF
jgi:Helicase associated domain